MDLEVESEEELLSVVVAVLSPQGGHGSEHHNAGQSGNGANEDVLLHDYYLIPLSTIRGRLSAARSIHDNYKRIGGFKGPKPKSVNRR